MLPSAAHSGVEATEDPSLRLRWNEAGREQWNAWITRVGRSNLLQSWAYGAAKSDTGWRVQRGVFYRDDKPIALVQSLHKRIAGLVQVDRINRGPLFLSEMPGSDVAAVWRHLARLGNGWKGKILSVAPELPRSDSSTEVMRRAGFRRRDSPATESIWIDLSLADRALRQRLTGKWRRWASSLDAPEKKGLSLAIDVDNDAFEWMLGKHGELMQSRDFRGPPTTLLRSLYQHSEQAEAPLVLRAHSEGEVVAGICLARHGASATYLVGWNGPVGRKLGANQFMFWFAIKQLKALGLSWFDLGGISQKDTPGITEFKLGLGGERYELVGEYLKW